jgi:integrase/recombinase XerD
MPRLPIPQCGASLGKLVSGAGAVPQFIAPSGPEGEWLAQFISPHSRRAYAADVRDFLLFARIGSTEALRAVRREQVLGWRNQLQQTGASAATLRRKLAALASLFRHLGQSGLVESNPVDGVRRPSVEGYEGKTPALSDSQARDLLQAPDARTLKGLRDRAILALLLFQGLRRSELTGLNQADLHPDRGQWRLRISGKGGRQRLLPMHPEALECVHRYLDAGPPRRPEAPLFLALRNARGDGRLSAQAVYHSVVRRYGAPLGLTRLPGFGPHVMRATAATQALEQGADLATVQAWLGHASIQTTRAYDRRDLVAKAALLRISYR